MRAKKKRFRCCPEGSESEGVKNSGSDARKKLKATERSHGRRRDFGGLVLGGEKQVLRILAIRHSATRGGVLMKDVREQ